MKFTTKQEYLAYRTQWKLEYKQLSQKIRDFRWMRTQFQKVSQELAQEKYKDIPPTDAMVCYRLKYDELFKKHALKYHYQTFHTHNLKHTATQMLLELKDAKIEAQRQYLANKQSAICV